MTVQDISVELEKREVIKKGLKALRQGGKIPAVIHDHGKESIHVMGDVIELHKIYRVAGKHHPIQLSVGKEQHLAMIKDVDFEPAKHRMRHIVFQAIKLNEETEAEVPIVFKEVEIPAEKLSLLILKQLDRVQIKALPKDLPDEIVIDPGKLTEVGDHLTVADLEVPSGVTVLNDSTLQIAIVEMPKDQEADANAAAAEMAGATETADVADTAENKTTQEPASTE